MENALASRPKYVFLHTSKSQSHQHHIYKCSDDRTFILCRCSSFSFSWRPMLSLVLRCRKLTNQMIKHFINLKNHKTWILASGSYSLSIMSLMVWYSCLCFSSMNSSKRFSCSDSELATSATSFSCISCRSFSAIWEHRFKIRSGETAELPMPGYSTFNFDSLRNCLQKSRTKLVV